MSNMKVIYDCEKKTTSYVPLSGAEIAEREASVLAFAEAEAARELETPAEETTGESETPTE